MVQTRHLLLRLLALGIPALLAGCGSGPGFVPVKGTLAVDGKPLANAYVMFKSQEPDGKDAGGSTDAAGVFHLSTVRPGDGALPGRYKITVVYSEAPKFAVVPKGPAEAMLAGQEAGASPATVVLPEIYTQLDQTVLHHRIPDDGEVKLDLKSQRP